MITVPAASVRGRLLAGAVGLLGAGTVVYGIRQPWVTTFDGLLARSGWGTRNGTILVVLAVAAGLLAVVQVVVATTILRWILGLVGFGSAAFAGYLLIELLTLTRSTGSLVFLDRGSGLIIAAVGSAAIAATMVLPMPVDARVADARPVPVRRGPPFVTYPLCSRLRFPAALLTLVAGLAHVPVTPDHLNEAPYIGRLFIALTVACALLAATLLIHDSGAVYLGAGLACLLAVLAYVLSRTVGLPMMADDIGNWLETLGVLSLVTEGGVVVVSTGAIGRAWRTAQS